MRGNKRQRSEKKEKAREALKEKGRKEVWKFRAFV